MQALKVTFGRGHIADGLPDVALLPVRGCEFSR